MGRGDKRSKRGKRTLGSFGVKRRARVQIKVLRNVVEANAETKKDVDTKVKVAKTKTAKTKKEV